MADSDGAGRVLLVCDAYPMHPGDRSAASARAKVWEWRARGHEVRVLAADPQPPGSLSPGYLEVEEGWVEGVPVHQVRFAPPGRPRANLGHGSEPLLEMALERVWLQFQPSLLCLLLGPFFGAIPLRKAVEHNIPVELVDSESILNRAEPDRSRRRRRPGFRRTGAAHPSCAPRSG